MSLQHETPGIRVIMIGWSVAIANPAGLAEIRIRIATEGSPVVRSMQTVTRTLLNKKHFLERCFPCGLPIANLAKFGCGHGAKLV